MPHEEGQGGWGPGWVGIQQGQEEGCTQFCTGKPLIGSPQKSLTTSSMQHSVFTH